LAGARDERARQRLSPAVMAVRTGIDRATISELETDKIADPTISASTWIRPMSRPTFVAAISVILIPVIFLSITSTWEFIDAFLGSREVSRYIKDHQSVVARRLNDPKVHSFTLEHDPSQWAALLIEFDVDDKATYEMLESDLDDIGNLRFPPQWKTTIRSKEDLGNNYGYAMLGIREVAELIQRIVIAGLVAIAQAGLFILIAVRCWYRRDRVG
jgi:transcriptional regulator with XRE-family HTH domain